MNKFGRAIISSDLPMKEFNAVMAAVSELRTTRSMIVRKALRHYLESLGFDTEVNQ
jgi:metal-responsive CopG/Arc/MetJ family transcriptional regulator